MPMSDQRSRLPTLRDVAERANVSKQTISRVINSHPDVKESTRQRVLEVVRELGYQPNSLARSLATSQSQVIGLVLPDISLPFYPEIARGVEDGAQHADYGVFLCNAAGSAERELQALERLQRHRTGGIIVCNSRLDDEPLERAVKRPVPIVLVNRQLPKMSGTVIWTGYESGAMLATDHLIALGRRRIAYLGLGEQHRFNHIKQNGYLAALAKAAIPFDPGLLFAAEGTLQGGYDAMAAALARDQPIDGVFAFNDHMAIGAMRYLASQGYRVPDDVAVVGFGGADVTGMVTPPLSTIRVPLYDIGLTAVYELLRLIRGEGQERRQVHSQPELVIRASSGGIAPPNASLVSVGLDISPSGQRNTSAK